MAKKFSTKVGKKINEKIARNIDKQEQAEAVKQLKLQAKIEKKKAIFNDELESEYYENGMKRKRFGIFSFTKLSAYIAALSAGAIGFGYLAINNANKTQMIYTIDELTLSFRNKSDAVQYVNTVSSYATAAVPTTLYNISGIYNTSFAMEDQRTLHGVYESFARSLAQLTSQKVYISKDALNAPTGSFGVDSYWQNLDATRDLATNISKYYLGMRDVDADGTLESAPFATERDAITSIGETATQVFIFNSTTYSSIDDVVNAVIADRGIVVDKRDFFKFDQTGYDYSNGQSLPVNTPEEFYPTVQQALDEGTKVINDYEWSIVEENITHTTDEWASTLLDDDSSIIKFEDQMNAWFANNNVPQEVKGGVLYTINSVNAEGVPSYGGKINYQTSNANKKFLDGTQMTSTVPGWLGSHTWSKRANLPLISTTSTYGSFMYAMWTNFYDNTLNNLGMKEMLEECVPCNGSTPIKTSTSGGYAACGYTNDQVPIDGLKANKAYISWWDHWEDFVELAQLKSPNVSTKRNTFDRYDPFDANNIKCVQNSATSRWGVDTTELDQVFTDTYIFGSKEDEDCNLTCRLGARDGKAAYYTLELVNPTKEEYLSSFQATVDFNTWTSHADQLDNVRWNGTAYTSKDAQQLNDDIIGRSLGKIVNAWITSKEFNYVTNFNIAGVGISADTMFDSVADATAAIDTAIKNWAPWTDTSGYKVRANNPYGLPVDNTKSYTFDELSVLVRNSPQWSDQKISDSKLLLINPDVKWADVVEFDTLARTSLKNFNGAGNDYVFNTIDIFTAQGIITANIEGITWKSREVIDEEHVSYYLIAEKVQGNKPSGTPNEPTYFATLEEAMTHWRDLVVDK